MKKQLFLIILLAAVLNVNAEVYLPGPGRGRSGQGDRLEGVLPGMEKVLHKEKITVNSFTTDLEVSAVRRDFEDILISLRRMKVEKLNVSGGTIRFERKRGNSGMVERFLLIASRKNRAVTCFRMVVPEKLPPPSQWPRELPPLPPGAAITAVTYLADGGICGEFREAREPAYVQLRRVDSLMRNRKMYPMGNEIGSSTGGRGEIFYSKKAIVWVNFSDTGHGAFFYRRRKQPREKSTF